MPITTYLDGAKYDDETKRIMGLAFGLVCTTLRAGDSDDYVKRAIAGKGDFFTSYCRALAFRNISSPLPDAIAWALLRV
jgi:hypothetical protein